MMVFKRQESCLLKDGRGSREYGRITLNRVTAGLIVLCLFSSGCFGQVGCDGGDEEQPLYLQEIHEWGVFQQKYGSNETELRAGPHSGEPPVPEVVLQYDSKPVIYFHGNGIGEVSVSVLTHATEIVTIPQATVIDGNIHWNVTVAGDVTGIRDEEAIVIDGVGKTAIETGDRYRYLFYEGVEKSPQNIQANVTRDGNSASLNITNIGDHELEDVYFFYDSGNGTEGMLIQRIVALGVQEHHRYDHELNGSFRYRVDMRDTLGSILLERGLSEGEREDLLEFWIDGKEDELGYRVERPWFQGNGSETAFVLYFISQEEYDDMLPLETTPSTQNIIRVGITTVSDIPVIRNS
jgi:hypothetical protein